MFFKSSAPNISDEYAYIKWFIKNDKDLKPLRTHYKHVSKAFVEACAQSAMKMLREHGDSDALFEHVLNIADSYKRTMVPFINNNGGWDGCSQSVQDAATNMLMNMFIGVEFLEKKYNNYKLTALINLLR